MKKLFLILCIILFFTACGQQSDINASKMNTSQTTEEEKQLFSPLYVERIEKWTVEQQEIYNRCTTGRNVNAQDGIFAILMGDVRKTGETYYQWTYNTNNGESGFEEITKEIYDAKCEKNSSMIEDGYMTYVDYEGYRYYIEGSDICCMDLTTKKSQSVFDTVQNAVGTGVKHLTVTDEGQLCLLVADMKEGTIFYLTEDKPEITENAVRFVSLTSEALLLPTFATEFSRLNPETAIEYEFDGENTEDLRTRVLADISAGHGPDMLWVSLDDMRTFAEKGLLQDLTELIEADTLEQIFPGIIETGTIDGQLVGLVPEGNVFNTVTMDNIWEQDTWRLDQIIGLVYENPNLEGMIGYGGGEMPGSMSPDELLQEVVLNHLDNSAFIDWEKRQSNFNSEEFIEVLEVFKRYGNERRFSEGYEYESLKDNKFLAWRFVSNNISMYAKNQISFGEEGHTIRMDSGKPYTGYWSTWGILVVNKYSQKQDTIKAFLEYVLSADNQSRSLITSVREDAIRSCMVSDTEFLVAKAMSYDVPLTPEGTSYLEEYIDFLKNCGPVPYTDEHIEEIILEEAELFFEGSKTAEQTAEIIQNRVQLYLDEK